MQKDMRVVQSLDASCPGSDAVSPYISSLLTATYVYANLEELQRSLYCYNNLSVGRHHQTVQNLLSELYRVKRSPMLYRALVSNADAQAPPELCGFCMLFS